MTCAPIVRPARAVLNQAQTIAQAVQMFAAAGFEPLPVVDDDGRLVGVFGPRELSTLLLPMGARLAGDNFDLGFVSEPLADLRERLTDAQDATVGEHAAEHDPVHPDTSLDEVLLRLHRGESFLVAVDQDNRVVGVVTAAAVLSHVVEAR
ncbi:MAG TPA: CBS domain-containing protein [Magnetospirillum sp.]|nr:CBS domain-containing protein [Magnetospirillum sp.]